MTQPQSWSSPEFAASWHQADGGLSAVLEFPWAIATALIGQGGAGPRLVVDVGSGPGTFLARVLQAYPDARGVWLDASPAMRDLAEETLKPFAGRVEFVVKDGAGLAEVPAAAGADVVLNSRVSHHFDAAGLAAFYTAAASVLRPDGWLVTLDHIRPPGNWRRRYQEVLPIFAGPEAGQPRHQHPYPFPTMEGQLAAFAAAGFTDCDVVWRALFTCLFVGCRPS